MSCRVVNPNEITLLIDDEVIPVGKAPIQYGNNTFTTADANFRLCVNRLTGRTFKAEVAASFPIYHQVINPHKWKLDVLGAPGYIYGYTDNPAIITAPPWPVNGSCGSCCVFEGLIKPEEEELCSFRVFLELIGQHHPL